MQQLMMMLDRDQYIHWHRLKDDNVVPDLFSSHRDALKLTNFCNLVFLIDNTYKTNRYKLSLLDIVGVTPTGMTFSADFAYLKGERLNNVVWVLQRFQGLFMRVDALLEVIATNRDLSLMNAVKILFPDATNLLFWFHIDKNLKAKCKTLVAQKNAWDYAMGAWGVWLTVHVRVLLMSTLKTLKWLALCGLCLWTMWANFPIWGFFKKYFPKWGSFVIISGRGQFLT